VVLHHVQLACPAGSEEILRDFYAGVLGLTELPRPPVLAARGGCWFGGHGIELHLGVEEGFRPAKKAHPGILVTNLDSWAARLGTTGTAVQIDHELPGYRRFYAQDPVGNRLELLSPEPATWPLADGLKVRRAAIGDVGVIMAMLRDDPLGSRREGTDDAVYASAFERVDLDPNQLLVVLLDDQDVVGTCQLTFVAGLSRQGATRMLIEAVRVRADRRGQRLGEKLVGWSLELARERGARIAQLTTDKSRTDAHRFYARLGFTASHEGMKLTL